MKVDQWVAAEKKTIQMVCLFTNINHHFYQDNITTYSNTKIFVKNLVNLLWQSLTKFSWNQGYFWYEYLCKNAAIECKALSEKKATQNQEASWKGLALVLSLLLGLFSSKPCFVINFTKDGELINEADHLVDKRNDVHVVGVGTVEPVKNQKGTHLCITYFNILGFLVHWRF